MASPAMRSGSSFDFIGDDSFRNSLESDYNEILRCLDCGAWKAVHVLAGSVVEAVLIDYLVTTDYKSRVGKDPLASNFGLAQAVEACRSEGVLSKKAADLSSVVGLYRNLIHPGRVIRLGEKIDPNTATIAKALLDVIVSEVAATKKEKYGFTAEQIANKMQKDSSVLGVLRHFLKDTTEHERVKLLTDILPNRYFTAVDDGFSSPTDISDCFRQVFDSLKDENKKAVTSRYVSLLKEGSERDIQLYEDAFFRARDIEFVNNSDIPLVKAHLLNRMQEHQPEFIDVVSGIGNALAESELSTVTDFFAHFVVYGKTNRLKEQAEEALKGLWMGTAPPSDEKIKNRIEEWMRFCEQKNLQCEMELLKQINESLEDLPPF